MGTKTVTWQRDEQGIVRGGMVGGDDAWSVRFVSSEVPNATVTFCYYPYNSTDDSGGFGVAEMIELMVTDGAGREVWSDYRYMGLSPSFDSLRQADAYAELMAASPTGDMIVWDGQPRYK